MKKTLACFFLLLGQIVRLFPEQMSPELYGFFSILSSLAIPLFAYLFVLGYLKTSDQKGYFLRLLSLALIAHGLLLVSSSFFSAPIAIFALNPVLLLLLGFALLLGWELLLSVPLDRIASMRLLFANPQTKSTRFDLRIGNGLSSSMPTVSNSFQSCPAPFRCILGICFIALSVFLALLLPIPYGLMTLLSIFIFYAAQVYAPKDKVLWALLGYSVITAIFLLTHFVNTQELSYYGASIAAFFLCALPDNRKRPSSAFQYSFYLFYPLHLVILLLIKWCFFKT